MLHGGKGLETNLRLRARKIQRKNKSKKENRQDKQPRATGDRQKISVNMKGERAKGRT